MITEQANRTAILMTRNIDRRTLWATRWYQLTGNKPDTARRWTPPHVAAEHRSEEAHGNGHIIKIPRRHRQYMHTKMPAA